MFTKKNEVRRKMHDSLLAWSCIRTSTNHPGRNPGQRSEELGPGQETEALGLRRLLRSPTGMFPPQAPRVRAERPAPAHTGACVCGPRATRRGQDESEAVLSGIYHSDAETRQSRDRVRPQTEDARSGCRGPSRCAAAPRYLRVEGEALPPSADSGSPVSGRGDECSPRCSPGAKDVAVAVEDSCCSAGRGPGKPRQPLLGPKRAFRHHGSPPCARDIIRDLS